jgi:hypothetical protein
MLEATERRASLIIVIGSMLAITLALALAVPLSMTVDDAKYIGIGANLLAGRGPTTVFGGFFPFHSPLWPLIIAAPSAWLGLEETAWAHALQILSAVAIVGLTAMLAWRVRPLVAAVAAPMLVAFGPLLDLGVGMGLDLPATAITLAYLVVGLDALDRGSARRGAAAGAVLAVAFLTKEVALPFAPVPFLAAIVTGTPWRIVARVAGATILVATAGVAWWFVLFAVETGEVYRLGTPAWTLPLIGAAVVAVGIGAVIAGRPSPEPGTVAAVGRLSPRLGWILVAGWVVALTAFFASTRFAVGQAFLDPEQVAAYLRMHGSAIGPTTVLALGGVGMLAAFGPSPRSGPATRGLAELAVAVLAGLPLLLVVVSVGELPRHYVTLTAILTAIGAAGIVALLGRLTARPDGAAVVATLVAGAAVGPLAAVAASVRSITPLLATFSALAGLTAAVVALVVARRSGGTAGAGRHLPWIAIAGVLAVAVAVMGINTVRVARPNPRDAAIREAVETAADWVRANVPAGETVAYGSVLAYETAVALQPTHAAVQIRELQDVQFDATAPLGVGRFERPATDDWLVLAMAPLRTDLLYGYRAQTLEAEIRASGATIWVQSIKAGSDDRVEGLFLDRLGSTPGIERLAAWTFDGGGRTAIFRIDPEALAFDVERLTLSAAALDHLVDGLRATDPGAAAPIAVRLLDRVEIVPPAAEGRTLLDALAAIAGR